MQTWSLWCQRVFLTSHNHYLSFNICVIKGTNNWVELHALLYFMKIASKKGMDRLQMFSDSKQVVEQANGTFMLSNITIGPLLEKTQTTVAQFLEISLKHLNRAFNNKACPISKLVCCNTYWNQYDGKPHRTGYYL